MGWSGDIFDLCSEGFYFLPQEPLGSFETWYCLVWHFALWLSCCSTRFVLLPWILEYICALTSFAWRLFVALRFFPSFHPSTHTLTSRPGATQKQAGRNSFSLCGLSQPRVAKLFCFVLGVFFWRTKEFSSLPLKVLSFCVPMSNSRGRY